MQDIFPETNIECYNLRKQINFQIPGPKTVTYGTESINVLDNKIWILIPNDLKSATNLFNIQNGYPTIVLVGYVRII